MAMVIDDEPLSRESLTLALKSYDLNIIEAVTGNEALQKIMDLKSKNQDISIMLVEMMLPGLSGIELIESLHRIDIHIPSIAISSYFDLRTDHKLNEYKIHEKLKKPFTSIDLENKIEKLLK